jgi:CheY-like chemotaxis protein
LRQILLNLVSNALKFTERGAITLAADFLGQSSPEMARIRFSVADTGIGIDADVQKLLFQEFAQADASIARRFGGTGLGLAISARLAEAMGGKIEISSQSGQGSLFWIDLDMPIAQSVETKEESDVQVPSLTLLVAEDNAINRQVISGILEARGHVVLLVEDGAQAVSAVEMGHFDAVLMDGWMPVLDGIDATRKIRALSDPAKASIPIIAMTANVTEADVQSYLAAGMNDALGKPVDLDRLDRALFKVAQQSGRTGHLAPEARTSGGCSTCVSSLPEAHGERLDPDILGQLRDALGLERLDEGFASLPQHWRERSLAIHEAGKKRDWPALARLAHDLKGTSGSFGLAGLSSFAADIEAAAKLGDEGGGDIEPLLAGFPAIVEQAIAALDAWRQNQN